MRKIASIIGALVVLGIGAAVVSAADPGSDGAQTYVVQNSHTVVVNDDYTMTAACKDGDVVTGGSVEGMVRIDSERPTPGTGTPTGWLANVHNTGNEATKVTVYAVCLET